MRQNTDNVDYWKTTSFSIRDGMGLWKLIKGSKWNNSDGILTITFEVE